MLADQPARAARWLAAAGATVLAAAVLTAAALAAGPAGPARAATGSPQIARQLKQVSYRGYTFTVPRSWQVIDEAGHPGRCVRFDVHAIYLGAPGPNQGCPSWLIGTTEAVLVQPAAARPGRVSTEDPTARVITLRDRRIRLTATFDTDPTAVYKIISSAALPAPVIKVPNPARFTAAGGHPGGAAVAGPKRRSGRLPDVTLVVGARRAWPAAHRRVPAGRPAQAGPELRRTGLRRTAAGTAAAAPARPRTALADLPTSVTAWRGLGFDSCAAPSAGYMRAWRKHSPYRAVGIYIGGADRACAQPNLTASWVGRQARAGWHFIPLYVGPQAAYGEIHAPQRQGTSAAKDAVVQAERLGLGPGTPLYYDMEAYGGGQSGRALSFLSAWTTELHRLGFLSGVYSSSESGVADLARQYQRHHYAMPDAIFDALWNGRANTSDPAYRSGLWGSRQRLHQYSGNVRQSYGGDPIDIDQDYLNVSLRWPGGTAQGTPAVTSAAGAIEVFYRGPGRHLWRASYSRRRGWSHPVNMGGTLESPPSAVDIGRGTVQVFYQGPHGYLDLRTGHWASGWKPVTTLTMMGAIGSPPRAVAQSNGVVDVFWRGSDDHHLWHGQYSPGHGWAGPQELGGSLAGTPAPVASSAGRVAVFWQGSNGALWQATRGIGGLWTRPASLGMAPLGGPVYATAQPGGGIEVAWRGSRPHSVWAAYRTASGRWTGPHDLGGSVSGAPWPVTAGGTEWVLWRNGKGGLWAVRRNRRGRFGVPVRLRSGSLRSAPFAAVGLPGSPVQVFWASRSGVLWSTAVSSKGTVSSRSLGGTVTGPSRHRARPAGQPRRRAHRGRGRPRLSLS